MLVAYLHHAVSAIGRGENAGRTLDEFNIVRNIRTLGEWKGRDLSRVSVIAAAGRHRRCSSRSAVRASPDHRSGRPRTSLK